MIVSGALEIIEVERVLHEAAHIKCERSIALGDCYTMALAKALDATAVFARQEEDLRREMKKRPFPVRLFFLEPR